MLISLKNIEFTYSQKNDNGAFRLSGIDININDGEFVTILGPNGSGKSTMLKIILNLLKPYRGTVLLDNKNVSNFSRKELARKLAFVPQSSFSIYPFSVYEIVMMGRSPYFDIWGYEKKQDIQKVNEALEMLGIYHLKKKGINEISGGEAQRAFIARALVQEPEVILLDEPNAHLDLEHQITIFEVLRKLNSENKLTIVLVSHDLNLAGCYGERVVLMKQGRILLDDNKFNILTEKNIRTIFKVDSKVIYDKEKNRINVALNPSG